MKRSWFRGLLAGSMLACSLIVAGMASAADAPAGLEKQGKPELKSAGPLTFGPAGVLFVGDPIGAQLFAIGVPAGSTSEPAGFKLESVDAKIAAALGIPASDLLINDMAVQPGTNVAYVSVSRGKGPDALPAIVTVNTKGEVAPVDLASVNYAVIAIKNAPGPDQKDRRGNLVRLESITDLAFVEEKLYVAGLSNEEFASTMRVIAFPFTSADTSTAVEIYHGAHGAYETRSPVRTFTPFMFGGEPHLLAAYTCTPLVKLPVADLKPGTKLRGTTIAELGNRNRPLDIVSYEKGGRTYLLMANSARGVMKMSTDEIEKVEGITSKIDDKAGLGYETLAGLEGVEHLDRLGEGDVLLLVRTTAGVKLESIPLP